MLRRVTLLLCLLAALAVPAGAFAQSSPFAPLPPAQTAAPDTGPVQTTSSSDTGGSGLKSWQEILIFGAGGVLLLGIAWAIVSDAREAAPTGDETEGQSESRARREAEHRQRKARARAAGKRSRAARKRNR
jgi:hypothetical protein